MKQLIVNADDFGLTEGVNQGVATAHEQGIVTSASLMVRRPGARSAAAYALERTNLGVGLHIDLGEWVYRDGVWHAVQVVESAPSEEILQQLTLFRALMGRDPTHLDSHQHVHRDEPVASALLEVARDLGVPLRGRDVKVKYRGDFYGQTSKGEPLHHAIGVRALVELLDAFPSGVTELGCHPGVRSRNLSYGVEREIELNTLCDPMVRVAIQAKGITLRTFSHVATFHPKP